MISLAIRSTPAAAAIGIGVLLGLAVAGASAYLYGPLINAKFGLIDDHEILAYFGTKTSVTLGDVPRILATQTEVGSWGDSLRFRPVYYFFRVLETVWHGLDPSAWYLTRIAIVTAISVGGGGIVYSALGASATTLRRRILGLGAALLGAIVLLTLPAWSDVVTRLGPSEIYVGLGLLVFAIGARVVWSARERCLGWILLAVGLIIVVGGKEDGLIFLPIFALIYFLRLPLTRTRILSLMLGALGVGFSIYVALGFLPAMLQFHADVYGNTRSPLVFIFRFFGNNYLTAAVIFLVLAIIIDRGLTSSEPQLPTGARRWIRLQYFLDSRPRTLVSGMALFVVVSELFFYESYFSNSVFSPLRYGLATELAVTTGLLIVITGVIELVLGRSAGWRVIVAAFVVLALLPPNVPQLIQAARTYHLTAVRTTAELNSESVQIARGVAQLRAHPGSQVAVIVQEPYDFEKIVGIASFLRLDDHLRSLYLDFQLRDATAAGSTSLISRLRGFADNGGWEQNGWRVRPSNQFNRSGETICFYFGRSPANLSLCSSTFPIG